MSKHKAARCGALFGVVIILLLMLLINGGLLSNLDVANEASLPTLVLASNIRPLLSLGLSIFMLLVIYNTAVGLIYPFMHGSLNLIPKNTKSSSLSDCCPIKR